MLVYICGAITKLGIEQAEKNFEKVEDYLVNKGLKVINPMKLPHKHDKSWESYMKECIVNLMNCDTIYIMSNWATSDGAQIEKKIAEALHYNIIFEA